MKQINEIMTLVFIKSMLGKYNWYTHELVSKINVEKFDKLIKEHLGNETN